MRGWIVGVAVLLVAGGGAWWLLRGQDPAGIAIPEEAPAPAADRAGEPTPGPQAEEGPRRVEEEALRRFEGERWREEMLRFAPGSGPVTGRELLEALAAARVLRVRAATPADLAALEVAVLEGVPRDEPIPIGLVDAFLREAGFQAQVHYPVLGFGRPPPLPGPPDAPR